MGVSVGLYIVSPWQGLFVQSGEVDHKNYWWTSQTDYVCTQVFLVTNRMPFVSTSYRGPTTVL